MFVEDAIIRALASVDADVGEAEGLLKGRRAGLSAVEVGQTDGLKTAVGPE